MTAIETDQKADSVVEFCSSSSASSQGKSLWSASSCVSENINIHENYTDYFLPRLFLPSSAILVFLNLRDALSLRQCCWSALTAVKCYRWRDYNAYVYGRMDLWEKCIPRATSLRIHPNYIFNNSGSESGSIKNALDNRTGRLNRLQYLNLSHLEINETDTFKCIAGLPALRTLIMCAIQLPSKDVFSILFDPTPLPLPLPNHSHPSSSTTVTVPATSTSSPIFTSPIKKLNISACRFRPLDWSCLIPLRHSQLDSLSMGSVKDRQINDSVFEVLAHIPSLTALDLNRCAQYTITDRGFLSLTNQSNCVARSLRILDMRFMNQKSITNSTLIAIFRNLKMLEIFDMSGCDQDTITDVAFAAIDPHSLPFLHTFAMRSCSQASITDHTLLAISSIPSLHTFNPSKCDQATITDSGLRAFVSHPSLTLIDLSHMNHNTITKEVIRSLAANPKLRYLYLDGRDLNDDPFKQPIRYFPFRYEAPLNVLMRDIPMANSDPHSSSSSSSP